jgi:hypothetical protein
MHVNRFLISSCFALVLLGGLSLVGGCGDESKQTGTLAPTMTPEDKKEMDESAAAYRAESNPKPKSKKSN